MGELKPCPFCGGDTQTRPFRITGKDLLQIYCSVCDFAQAPCSPEEYKKDVERWNRRTVND